MLKLKLSFILVLSSALLTWGCGSSDSISVDNDTENHQDKDKNKDKNNKDKDKAEEEDPDKDTSKDKDKDKDGDEDDEDSKKDPPKDPDPKPSVPDTCAAPDEDGDTISDELEGRADERDTDGDGEPDYKDEDSDNDTIPDKVEARNEGCSGTAPEDMDNDGVPNYLDDDSDNNGIADSEEAGTDPTHPVDTDGDTLPDYVSDDNDGDGVSDQEEITGMIKSGDDEITDESFSGDCDNDTLPDARGTVENPIDCDNNGLPDYLDKDSDGDTLPDAIEKDIIIGKFFARYSHDADGNGISDYAECTGKMTDEEVTELPEECIDTDKDGTPDFLDIDNDGDSLTDTYEISKGSGIYSQDTDGDTVLDYVEIAAGTDPANSADNPQSHGNFVFIVPFEEETSPKKQSLSFETAIQTIDLFFSFDQSGSMNEEVNSLRVSLKDMLTKLQCKDYGATCTENNDCAAYPHSICSEKGKCILSPSYGNGCFDSMYSGVGFYHYYNSFWVASPLSEGYQNSVNALDNMFLGNRFHSDGDFEVAYQAPICAAYGPTKDPSLCAQRSSSTQTCGNGTYNNCKMNCSTDSSRVGCVGYRQDAIRIFVHAFDENQCYYYENSQYSSMYADYMAGKSVCEKYKARVGNIMKEYKMRYVGLYSNQNTASNDSGVSNQGVADDIAQKSGSLSTSNQPFNYLAMDSGLADKAAQGIREISRNMPVKVTSAVEDITPGAAALVEALNVNISGETIQSRICTDVSAQGIGGSPFQSIEKLMPGTSVCYDVIPVNKQNIFPAKSEPQLLQARIKVMGDGSTLNSGIAYFIVPPVLVDEPGVN